MKHFYTFSFRVLVLCIFFALPLSPFAQYTPLKTISFTNEVGKKALVKSVDNILVKGNKVIYLGSNAIVTTDNSGLFVSKNENLYPQTSQFYSDASNVEVDKLGNYFILSSLNTIQKYSPKGMMLFSFDASIAVSDNFQSYDFDLEVDDSGTIYIGGYNGYVHKYDSQGRYLGRFGSSGFGDGQFFGVINKILVGSSGKIYVRSGGSTAYAKVQVFDNKGTYLSKIESSEGIKDFTIDSDEKIYVLKSSKNLNLYVYNNAGVELSKSSYSNDINEVGQIVFVKSNKQVVVQTLSLNDSQWRFFDASTKQMITDVYTPYTAPAPVSVRSIQTHHYTKRLFVLDDYKMMVYDSTYKEITSLRNFDAGIVAKYHPITFALDNKGKSYFLTPERSGAYNKYSLYEEGKPEQPLFTLSLDTTPEQIFMDYDEKMLPIVLIKAFDNLTAYYLNGQQYMKIISKGANKAYKKMDGNYLIINDSPKNILSFGFPFKTFIPKVYTGYSTVDGFVENSSSEYIHTVNVEDSRSLEIQSFDLSARNIASARVEVSQNGDAKIATIKDDIIVSREKSDEIKIFGFTPKANTRANIISGPNSLNYTTEITSKNISSEFKSSVNNLTYKIISGESVTISSTGELQIVKGGKSILEVRSAASGVYAETFTLVEISVDKAYQPFSYTTSYKKKTTDSDFTIEIKNTNNTKPTLSVLYGNSAEFNQATNTVKIVGIGQTYISVIAPEEDRYRGHFGSIIIDVESAPRLTPNITVSSISKKVDDVMFDLKPTTDSDSPFAYTLLEGNSVQVSATGQVKILQSGVSTVKVSTAQTLKYNAASANVVITISKYDQTITVNTLPNEVLQNVKTLDLTATASSSLPVAITVTGPAKYENGKITFTGIPGTVQIEISQAGNAKYNAISLKKTIEVKLVLGVDELGNNQGMVVYPNPFAEKINIDSDYQGGTIQIFDTKGQLMIEKILDGKQHEVNLQMLPSGVYILKFSKGEKSIQQKIMKY